jgi:hypothetical protein
MGWKIRRLLPVISSGSFTVFRMTAGTCKGKGKGKGKGKSKSKGKGKGEGEGKGKGKAKAKTKTRAKAKAKACGLAEDLLSHPSQNARWMGHPGGFGLRRKTAKARNGEVT